MAETKKNKSIKFWIGLSVLPLIILVLVIVFGALSNTPFLSDINKSTGNIIFIAIFFLPFAVMIIIVFRVFRRPFMSFFGGDRETRRIMANGRSAQAMVQQIGESSLGGVTTINEQPYLNLQLEVRDGNRPPYTVNLDTIIPRASVPQFQPGVMIPVKIDPNDANKIVIDWSGNAGSRVQSSSRSESGMPTVGNVHEWTAADNQLLEEQGIDGSAKILSLEDTGKSENFNPVVRLTYEVRGRNLDPYTFSKEIALPTPVVQQLKGVVRKSFPARIHPHDRTKIKVNVTF